MTANSAFLYRSGFSVIRQVNGTAGMGLTCPAYPLGCKTINTTEERYGVSLDRLAACQNMARSDDLILPADGADGDKAGRR